MAEITRSTSIFLPKSEFDAFLFAPIGEDKNGMLLSVLSALARLDVDPWQEAAKLARLPGETATQTLASLIRALPDGSLAYPDPGTIAARLIALLPRRRASSNIPSRETLLGVSPVTASHAVMYAMIVNVTYLAIALGAYIVANHQPRAQFDNAHAPASSTVFPQMQPRISGQ